ncbi:MAG: hypothetical protein Q8K99_06950 [Actinomycetota bacterium]|nr:hypothetical protein [Actinomycetota bacterium]
MQKHSSLVLALGVVVAASCAVGIAVADGVAVKTAPSVAVVPGSAASGETQTGMIVDAATEAELKDLGIRLKSSGDESVRTSDAAIRTAESLSIAQNASSVTATFALLSYNPSDGSLSSDVLIDRPVWFVSVRGVEIRRHGHPNMPLLPADERDVSSDGVHTEMNVIIDDATGEILQMFSFR